MAIRSKYRKITDLYVQGTEVVLRDGTPLWVQALNPFEYQEAQQQAAAGRSRYVMAMKEVGSDELTSFQADASNMRLESKIDRVVDLELSKRTRDIAFAIEVDKDWQETLDVIRRSDELSAGTAAEAELLEKKNREYLEEIARRQDDEREFLVKKYSNEGAEVLDEYLRDFWVDYQAGERSIAEYEISEVFFGARVCEGIQAEDGSWSHEKCDGHAVRVFDERHDVKQLPEELWNEIRMGFAMINMGPREAGNSDRLGSSSESSPQPSKPEDSQLSTQPEMSSDAPGTSPQPSPTLSPSSATSS